MLLNLGLEDEDFIMEKIQFWLEHGVRCCEFYYFRLLLLGFLFQGMDFWACQRRLWLILVLQLLELTLKGRINRLELLLLLFKVAVFDDEICKLLLKLHTLVLELLEHEIFLLIWCHVFADFIFQSFNVAFLVQHSRSERFNL